MNNIVSDIIINLYDVSESATHKIVDSIVDTVSQSDLIHVNNNPYEMYSSIRYKGFLMDLDWVKHELEQSKEDCMIGSFDIIGCENSEQTYYTTG